MDRGSDRRWFLFAIRITLALYILVFVGVVVVETVVVMMIMMCGFVECLRNRCLFL